MRSGSLYCGLAMSDAEGKVRRPSGPGLRAATAGGHPTSALEGLVAEGASVLLLGLRNSTMRVGPCWSRFRLSALWMSPVRYAP